MTNSNKSDCFDAGNIVVIDCGRNEGTIYDGATGECKTISHEAILNLPNTLESGKILVCENAHCGCPRTKKSLAQPFTGDELLTWYDELEKNGITLKLFPQSSTGTALRKFGLEKSDENDPKAIHMWLEKSPHLMKTLMNPKKSFEIPPVLKEGWAFKKETNATCNFARHDGYKNPEDHIVMFIEGNKEEIASRLSPDERDVFGLQERKKSGKDIGNFTKIKMSQMYSVVATLINPDGKLRIREITNAGPGWQFVKKYVFCMTPFHQFGGVARSNLMHHGLKNWASKKLDNKLKDKNGHRRKKKRKENFSEKEDIEFGCLKITNSNAIRALWQASRDILNDC